MESQAERRRAAAWRPDGGRAESVKAAVDSAPSGRDYDAEINAMLTKAEELRAAFDSAEMDMSALAQETIRRCGCAADVALQSGAYAAEDARAKIAEQQDRFKAGVLAEGLSLDDEEVEFEPRPREAEAPVGNKYTMLMNHRKKLQEQERLSGKVS